MPKFKRSCCSIDCERFLFPMCPTYQLQLIAACKSRHLFSELPMHYDCKHCVSACKASLTGKVTSTRSLRDLNPPKSGTLATQPLDLAACIAI